MSEDFALLGILAALGMGLGGFLFALLALLGLQAVLAAVPPEDPRRPVSRRARLAHLARRPEPAGRVGRSCASVRAFAASLLLLVFLIEAGWYALVALALSAEQPRAAYLRGKRWVGRLAGGVLILLGAKLVLDAQHT